MGTAVVPLCFILLALARSVDCLEKKGPGPFSSKAVYQDVWPDLTMLTGGFLGKPLMQPVGFNELGSSFPVPFHPWSFTDTGIRFTMKVVNSTLNGQAGTNVYKRGELVYLQVTSSGSPGQELYLHSCYAAPSPNFNDKSRLALVNKGCVSSKQPALTFIFRQGDELNFVLDTSSLKFSQIYVHCTVALSDGMTPEAKSCNYIADKARWVELGGQTDVCECCATKCKDPPHYQAPFGEFKAVVSAGPLSIKEWENKKQLLTGRTPITSPQIGASATSNRKPWIMSGASPSGALPSSPGQGWIVSGASVSGSSPWKTPPVDLLVSQGIGDALSHLLPGLIVGVQSIPVLEIEIGYPQKRSGTKVVPSQSTDPTDLFWMNPAASFEASLQREDPQQVTPPVKPRLQELIGMLDGFPLSDAPDFRGARHSADIPQPPFEISFDQPEEELRGDVFTNFGEPQLEKVSSEKNDVAPLYDSKDVPKDDDDPERMKAKEDNVLFVSHTEILFKKANADVLGKPESLKQSKLTLTGASDGSSSLENAEKQKATGLDDQNASTKLDTEKELVSSLMTLMRKLNKML